MFRKGLHAVFALSLVVLANCDGMQNASELNFLVVEKEIDDFVPHQMQAFSYFDWNFWKVISKSTSGNALVSPLSVKLGLALLYEGAEDQTANELAVALNLPASRPAARELFSEILRSLKETNSDYVLNLGTRLYVDSSITSRQRYNAIAKMFYETDVKNVNFSDTHTIATDINNWAKNLTQGNIDRMIEDENRLKDSVFMIASALFFKGTWKNHPFSKDNTVQGNFITTSASNVDVDYMRADSFFYFYHSQKLAAKVLRIPYKGAKYAMYFVLPDASDGLDQMIELINPTLMSRTVWHMEKLPVDVRIPKFKFQAGSHLEPALREMGVKEVFTKKATLPGFALNDNELYVSDVIHKAGIEVNEEGTSAFATTEIEIGNKNSGMSFYATHPFMFYIEDESTATIMYMGKVNNPRQGAGPPVIFGIPPRPPQPDYNNMNNTNNSDNSNNNISNGVNNNNNISISDNNSINWVNIGQPNGNFDKVGLRSEDRYNYFNIELGQKLFEEYQGNLVLSPTCVKQALMLLVEGTCGKTRQEIISTLRLPANLSAIRHLARNNLETLKNKSQHVQLHLATRFWASDDVKISDKYQKMVQSYYAGDISPLDFKNMNDAVKQINSWVRDKTNQFIQTIVDDGSLDSETRILITSAIHFKSQWKKSFVRNRTQNSCFKTFDKECKTVPMMESFDTYKYARVAALEAQVLEIPYLDEKFSFLLMLPNKQGKECLDNLSRDLSYVPISLLLKNLKDKEIELQLPKFSIENKFNLKRALSKIGVNDLFSVQANLTGALPESDYFVSEVIQNAKIDINEDGTEAAAVTGLTVVPLMAPSVIPVKFNRPFLFFVIEKSWNTILFSGRLVEP